MFTHDLLIDRQTRVSDGDRVALIFTPDRIGTVTNADDVFAVRVRCDNGDRIVAEYTELLPADYPAVVLATRKPPAAKTTRVTPRPTCDNDTNPVHARGLCAACYRTARKAA
jgi:hypothetical protein